MADTRPFKSGTKGASETRRRSRSRKRSRLRWIVLGVIAIVFGYIYIGGSYGWYNMWKLRQQRSQLQAELKELDSRKRVLTDELELLEGDAEADERTRFELERLAREEHGMVREDELIYRFPEQAADTTEAGASKPGP